MCSEHECVIITLLANSPFGVSVAFRGLKQSGFLGMRKNRREKGIVSNYLELSWKRSGGGGRIRTSEGIASRFTVCPV